ncbi:MAG: transcriptional regulator, family [Blastococcus sp.]|nr:transcriptional regulator, family [Blastococcus sp.]
MSAFDLPAALRRIRRVADASQRELAARAGTSKSTIAAAESGVRGLDVCVLARAAEAAGLRLALLDAKGHEAVGMNGDAVRDMSGRRFPAHLDTRYSDERWWHGRERYSRRQPWYTFDRHREGRDATRRRKGTPDDHQLPQHGDSPAARAAARRQRYWDEQAAERERRFAAGELARIDVGFRCDCPAACEELDDWSGRPVHAEECPCGCDVG